MTTLLEMKKKILRLIEEIDDTNVKLTSDPDIEEKLNDVINQIQFELARMKKIPAKVTKDIDISINKELNLNKDIENFYQLKLLKFTDKDGEEQTPYIIDTLATFNCNGTAEIYYYKYPEVITKETADTYVFELSQDALEIMPYGVASDVLKGDPSTQYGQIYGQRYRSMMEVLDSRYNTGTYYIEGGVDI